MVDPYGHALPLQDAYQKTMDFALEKVATGATDINTAIRDATKNLAKYGIRSIDYQSGVSRSLEAAVRGCIMGGLGLMQEQISQKNHDDMGADGWEISAHAASAPDHEPIQGKQYTDAEYTALNNSLVRRIGTLNCGHAAFPIILGVNEPQYTEEQLEEFCRQNEKGITYQGKHYTMYEATQTQRKLERSMRTTKRKILLDEELKDDEHLLYDQIRLRRLNEEYVRFSKEAGMPTQRERAQLVYFDIKKSGAMRRAANRAKKAGVNVSSKTLDKYFDVKYNNSPNYKVLTRYIEDVESGWISPLIGFEEYLEIYDRINNEIVGKTLSGDIVVKGQTAHFMQRVVGTMIDPKKKKEDLRIIRRSGVEFDDIKDALFNPQNVSDVEIKDNGKPSIVFIGEKCVVSINPESGELIQTNPLGGNK